MFSRQAFKARAIQKNAIRLEITMINKKIAILLILCLFPVKNAFCKITPKGDSQTIKLIYENRDHIIALINMYSEGAKKKFSSFQYPSNDTLLISKSRSYLEWVKDESKITAMAMTYKDVTCNYMKKCNCNIIDTFYIKLVGYPLKYP
jgi:hypothetical protein